MSRTSNKSLFKFLSVASCAFITLSSCSTKEWNKDQPSDQNEALVTVDGNTINMSDIYYNSKGEYYDNITDTNTAALNKLLDAVVQTKVDSNFDTALTEAEITQKAQQAMLDKVTGGTYDVDSRFDEEAFVRSLTKDMKKIDTKTCNFNRVKPVVTTKSTYDEVFTCDYSNYISTDITPSILRNQLVTEYIYDESYSSIGITAARGVNIVILKDGDNKYAGAASKFMNAFLDDLAKNDDAHAYAKDLNTLSLAYTGFITDPKQAESYVNDNVKQFFTNHPELKALTEYQRIQDEIAKIATYDSATDSYTVLDAGKADTTLLDKYTGSYKYSIKAGVEKQRASLLKNTNGISGLYLSSETLTGVNDTIKSRIFSSNYNVTDDSSRVDVTTMLGGKRFLTVATGSNNGDTSTYSNIKHYDSSSTSYVLVEITDVVNGTALARNSNDSAEVAAKKKDLAKKVSYKMVDNSDYRTKSTVHWLKDFNITFHNETFYNYMKSTYPLLFDKDTYED